MPKVYRVFVSSVFEAIKRDREAIIMKIDGLDDCTPVAMERMGARAGNTLEECLAAVRECDIFLGIIGPRYGSRPETGPETRLSYTEYEFGEAEKFNIPRLMFIMGDDFLKSGADADPDQESLNSFRERVSKAQIVDKLVNDNGYVARCVTALHNEIRKLGRSESNYPTQLPIVAIITI